MLYENSKGCGYRLSQNMIIRAVLPLKTATGNQFPKSITIAYR